jgi:hypothetical protein
MPRFVRPDGRTDLVRTAVDLATHLLANCRGGVNRIGAKDVAHIYGINQAQARDCAQRARDLIEPSLGTLCGKPGPKGGWWIAETEEEARSHQARRHQYEATHVRKSKRSARASRRGVVSGKPSAIQKAWAATEKGLSTVGHDLAEVRRELPAP